MKRSISMDSEKFGMFIAELRKVKGFTQAQLAQKLNVTDKAVSKWERGVGFPDIKLLEPLADALGISLLELMKSERLPQEAVSSASSADALRNVIDVAVYEKKLVRQRLTLITVLIILSVTAVFLVDTMQPIGFLFVCLPVILCFLGIWFLWLSRKKAEHKRLFLALGLLAFLYPFFLLLFFCFAFVLGGPVPD